MIKILSKKLEDKVSLFSCIKLSNIFIARERMPSYKIYTYKFVKAGGLGSSDL